MARPPEPSTGVRGAVHVAKVAICTGRGGPHPPTAIEIAAPGPAEATVPPTARGTPTVAAPLPIASTVGAPLRSLAGGLPAPAILRRRAAAVQIVTKDVPEAAGRAAPIKAPLAGQVGAAPPVIRAANGDHSRKIIGPRPTRPFPAVPGAVAVGVGEDRPTPLETLPAQVDVLLEAGGRRLPEGVVPADVVRLPIRIRVVTAPSFREGASATQRRAPSVGEGAAPTAFRTPLRRSTPWPLG